MKALTYVVEATPDTRHYVFPNRRVSRIDTTPLAACHSLESFEISANDITELDLSPLGSCRRLKSLRVILNPLERVDLRPLASCSSLETLALAGGRLEAIDLTPLCSSPNLVSIDLARNRFQSVDLEPLSSCPNLREIDLGGNALRNVLLPRSSSLKYLDLSRNRLERIDMAPLADCHSLETLNLSRNQFASLDLSPLYKCQELKHLYMSSKTLKHLDVTPLTISAKRPPTLVMGKNVALTAWAPPGRILKAAYRRVVVEPLKSWTQVRPFIQGGGSYLVQQNLLSALGFSRFGMIDCDLSEQLSSIPPDTPLDKAKRRIERVLVERVVRQIDSGATTIGLRLEDTTGHREIATRVSRVVELRRAEMESLLISVHGGVVDLRPLWLTAYGFDMLLALHAEVRTDLVRLENVRHAMEKAGFELRTTTKRFRLGSTSVSSGLGRCIVQMAQHGPENV